MLQNASTGQPKQESIRMCYRLLLVPLLLLWPTLSHADIYRCPQANGEAVFKQQPCDAMSVPMRQPDPVDDGSDCSRLAELVQRIGLGLQASQTASSLRLQLAPHYSAERLDQAFSLFTYAGPIGAADLTNIAQLICETKRPLQPASWLNSKTELTLRLGSWQQQLLWPSSWRLIGLKVSTGVQFALRYADYGDNSLRIGCSPFASNDRLQAAGHHVLAMWANALQPGAPKGNQSPLQFGNDIGLDADSKRQLLSAQLPVSGDGTGRIEVSESTAYVAFTPQHMCLAVMQYQTPGRAMSEQTRTLVSSLLSKKKMSLQQYDR